MTANEGQQARSERLKTLMAEAGLKLHKKEGRAEILKQTIDPAVWRRPVYTESIIYNQASYWREGQSDDIILSRVNALAGEKGQEAFTELLYGSKEDQARIREIRDILREIYAEYRETIPDYVIANEELKEAYEKLNIRVEQKLFKYVQDITIREPKGYVNKYTKEHDDARTLEKPAHVISWNAPEGTKAYIHTKRHVRFSVKFSWCGKEQKIKLMGGKYFKKIEEFSEKILDHEILAHLITCAGTYESKPFLNGYLKGFDGTEPAEHVKTFKQCRKAYLFFMAVLGHDEYVKLREICSRL